MNFYLQGLADSLRAALAVQEPSESFTIATALQSVGEAQINALSDRMKAILARRFGDSLSGAPDVRRHKIVAGTLVEVVSSAKEELISNAPFAREMAFIFQMGELAEVGRGRLHEYTCDSLIQHAGRDGFHDIQGAVGARLQHLAKYILSLSVDLEESRRLSKLVFVITETDNAKPITSESICVS